MDDEIKRLVKSACKRLTGFKKRSYQAEITSEYFDGSARKAEQEMGGAEKVSKKARKKLKAGSDAQIIIKDAVERGRKIQFPALKRL